MPVINRNNLSDIAGSRNLNMGAAEANMTAVAASDTVNNADGRTMLIISNQGGSSDTVTIVAQSTGQRTATGASVAATNETVVLATTERRILGPFPPSVFNDASGFITVNHSFTTSVRIYAFALPG